MSRRNRITLALLSALALALASSLISGSAFGKRAPKGFKIKAPAPAADPAAGLPASAVLGHASNDFGFDVYKRLAAADDQNVFISPYSISTALTMTYAGARGKTAAEMARVLRIEGLGAASHLEHAKLMASLTTTDGKAKYSLHVANRLFGQRGYPFMPDFLGVTDKHYRAPLKLVDYARAPEPTRIDINHWVEKKTKKRIADLIPAGAITTDTRLVLANAIYFKGDWSNAFEKKNTKTEDFERLDGKKVSAKLMNRTGAYKVAEVDGVQVLELPYKGDKLSMVVLLPKDRSAKAFAAMESALTAEKLATWTSGAHRGEVVVSLPRFELDGQTIPLAELLSDLGMKEAFTPPRPDGSGADFSGMTGGRELYISAVFHKGFVDVNEKGTEAAAATAVIMSREGSVALPPTVFRADHPFVFAIRDNTSGTVLFLGRLTDPTT